tara:strand:- start:11875 stop:12291 length:417 start_codon:yes stop_codon:yes gene_type:complete
MVVFRKFNMVLMLGLEKIDTFIYHNALQPSTKGYLALILMDFLKSFYKGFLQNVFRIVRVFQKTERNPEHPITVLFVKRHLGPTVVRFALCYNIDLKHFGQFPSLVTVVRYPKDGRNIRMLQKTFIFTQVPFHIAKSV